VIRVSGATDNSTMGDTEFSLASLAALLREDPIISPHVRDTAAEPALGELAASGPRAATAPGPYVELFEAIREGYLLHFGEPRLIDGADADLRLLTGDYLYAIGLERLAAMGDLPAVRELADLISLSAQVYAEPRGGPREELPVAKALWLGSGVAVAAGASHAHQEAKQALREGDPNAGDLLSRAAHDSAESAGIGSALARAADSIGFAALDPDRG
jgi:hypothetical protein